MFEEFSGGYYLGRLYVEPDDGEAPSICRTQHEQLRERIYDGTTPAAADRPLVVKLGSHHLAVRAEDGVPADTLSVPGAILADTSVRNPPTLREVLLAKAERAAQLLRLTGARDPPSSTDGPDGPDGPAGI